MAAALALGARVAHAGPDPVAVRERFEALHQTAGIAVAGFEVRPSVGVEAGYDSNVAQSAGGAASTALGLRGTVDARLRSGIYTIELGAAAAQRWYPDAPGYDSFTGALRGGLSVELSQLTLRASAAYAEEVERPRNNGIVVDGVFEAFETPAQVTHVPLQLEAEYRAGALIFAASARADRVAAERQRTQSGATVEPEARTGFEYAYRARGSYAFSPAYDVFVEAGGDLQRYDAQAAGSDTWRAVVGGRFEITRLIVGEVRAGVAEQTFADGASASGFVYGARFRWFAHELLTLTFEAERGFSAEAEQAGGVTFAVPAASDAFRVRAEAEPLRTLIVFAEGAYETSDRGQRDETFTSLSLGAAWAFAPHFRLEAEVAHLMGASNFAGDFARTQVNVGVTAAY